MFTTAIDKYLYRSSEIELDYMKSNYGQDYINANYDMIVFPTANIFGTHYIQGLERYTDFFRKIKIPVYVIGAGIQCNSYDDISDLAAKLKETVGEFISAVYQTGGEFALRGYATKEFLDLIIKNTAVVTGCPSLYQNGRELKVNTEKVEKEKFRVALNGSVKSINATNLKKLLIMLHIWIRMNLLNCFMLTIIRIRYQRQRPCGDIRIVDSGWFQRNVSI